MPRTISIGVIQAAFSNDMGENIDTVSRLVREAAGKGAKIVLPPELFQGPYFCKTQEERWFETAYPSMDHPCVTALQTVARDLDVAIPVSIFERDGPHYYNSIVMLDAGGEALGVYRKTHIPDGPGYQEKYYFRPGDTGFKVWDTKHGRVGVGICWDQWFPETARAMAMMGADVLLYPTAIGSEPHDTSLDTAMRWRRAMQGHAVSNVMPIGAANRVGDEDGQVFYGTSFICDHTGEVKAELDRDQSGVLVAEFDLDFLDRHRAAWGFFRDRRPEFYR
ncbi:N-carbamoylputrescine amidase [Marinicauda sp. Alg238-R41]|uniref:N-carbamoylputrescine amidase n=1 Tax=Marinicauda sp. Alg238-R41 TaxID=2993447 RepID=UPI0022E6AC33|nr:N-carbamoylputrescine amidase [Marinicauda sp. Alg238-R41]